MELELWCVGRQIASKSREFRTVLKGVKKVFCNALENKRVVVAVRKDVAGKAVRLAESLDGGRQCSHALDVRMGADELLDVLLDLLSGGLSVIPVPELEDEGGGVAADITAHRVEAHHRYDALNGAVLLEVLKNFR